MLSGPVAAQSNPTMTTVIPDDGEFATQGRIQAIDPGASTLTIVPDSNHPVPMAVASGVDLTSIPAGGVASVHYTRLVTFVAAAPNVPVAQVPATATVEPVAQTVGGIGHSAAAIVGRVAKLNGSSGFDVVNFNGGGIYTIQTTNSTREAAIRLLKVGTRLPFPCVGLCHLCRQMRSVRQRPVRVLAGIAAGPPQCEERPWLTPVFLSAT